MLYFLMLFAGLVLFIIKDIARWNKGTPDILPLETAKQYFNMNWLTIVGSIILSIVMLVLALNGEFDMFAMLNLPPALTLTGTFLIGVGSASLFKQWAGTVPEMKTTYGTIDTAPKKDLTEKTE